jgi:hypothetical protein
VNVRWPEYSKPVAGGEPEYVKTAVKLPGALPAMLQAVQISVPCALKDPSLYVREISVSLANPTRSPAYVNVAFSSAKAFPSAVWTGVKVSLGFRSS